MSPNFQEFLNRFPYIVDPLKALDVMVINASRETALTLFPRMSIEDALSC